MSPSGRYQKVKNPCPGGRLIERIPGRLAQKRQDALMAALQPIYERAARICRSKGQKKLRDYEGRDAA
jgi:hypothetical protein